MSDPANIPARPRVRLVPRNKDDRIKAVAIGRRKRWLGDLYVRLLDAAWARLAITILFLYISINVAFALAYLATNGGIENARAGSFVDAFFFSVQTFATIGYGKMAPVGMAANLLVTLEALLGFSFYAMVTGLVFSKFSRPTARVLFSNVAVIGPYNGVPHLMFRLANERGNGIVEASLKLSMLKDDVSSEGHRMRRFHDLKLVRDHIPVLQLSWTVMHPIDQESPLYNLTPTELETNKTELVATLTGLDDTLAQTIHARFSYLPHEILFNTAFKDIMHRTLDAIEINYTLLHDTRPLGPDNQDS